MTVEFTVPGEINRTTLKHGVRRVWRETGAWVLKLESGIEWRIPGAHIVGIFNDGEV